MFWVLFQTLLIFGIMGVGIYYFVKKIKENQFNKIGEKGKIEILDGVNLSYQTSTYLLSIDNQQVLVVVGANGISTTVLKDKRFEELLVDGIEDEFAEEVEENE